MIVGTCSHAPHLRPRATHARILSLGFALLAATSLALAAPRTKTPTVERSVRDEVRAAQKAAANRSPVVRYHGVLTLAFLAAEAWEPRSFTTSVESLIRAVEDEDPDVAQVASQAVEALFRSNSLTAWTGSILTSSLEDALANRNTHSRLIAVRCLFQANPLHTAATETFADLVTHPDPEIRSEAIQELPRLPRARALTPNGTIVRLIHQQLDSADSDQRFDAARALWLFGQLSGDEAAVSNSETALVRALVNTPSGELGDVLNDCLLVFDYPPQGPPGELLTAALKRFTEDQPPETALPAAVALALLEPAESGLGLTHRFQQLLPGYLTHASPSVRIATANVIGNYAGRLLRDSASGDRDLQTPSPPPSDTWLIAPELRPVLTNLFALPNAQARLRGLSQVCRDPVFVTDHREALAQSLLEGLSFANREMVRVALIPSLDPVWALPEAAPARGVLLNNLPLWDGIRCQMALSFLRRTGSVFDRSDLSAAVLAQAQSASPGPRSAAATTLLDWIQSRDRGQGRLQDSTPEILQALALDPHPLVSSGGVAGLIAASDRLSPFETECRSRLVQLLEANTPSVRCRFVSLILGATHPLNKVDLQLPELDPEGLGSQVPWVKERLGTLLQEVDPLLHTKARQALTRF